MMPFDPAQGVTIDQSVMPFDGLLPACRRDAMLRALHAAFGNAPLRSVERMAWGASQAGVFRIQVNDADYLLRIEGPPTGFADPSRQYACQSVAAAAGIAPAVVYADAKDGVSISDFVHATPFGTTASRTARLQQIVRTIAKLHALPPFAARIRYVDAVDSFVRNIHASGILPEEAVRPHFRCYEQLAKACPSRTEDLVSSHNDLNPSNVLFAGERAWIVDWDSAFVADRHIDLAAAVNFWACGPEEEALMLGTYFGPALDDACRARFFLVQQVNRMFYAMALLGTVVAARPETRLTAECLQTPRLDEARNEMASLATIEGRQRFGCIFLNEVLHQVQSRRFADAVSMMS